MSPEGSLAFTVASSICCTSPLTSTLPRGGALSTLGVRSVYSRARKFVCPIIPRIPLTLSASQIANALIQKVSGGLNQTFRTKEEAEAAFERAKQAGVVKKVTDAAVELVA